MNPILNSGYSQPTELSQVRHPSQNFNPAPTNPAAASDHSLEFSVTPLTTSSFNQEGPNLSDTIVNMQKALNSLDSNRRSKNLIVAGFFTNA